MPDTDSLLERRYRVMGRHSPLFYERPVHLVEGKGVWVKDIDGRTYLDVYNNVPCVGHCNPHVVEAICTQAAKLNLHTRYLHENVVNYAERLTATFDDPLDAAMLTCTGTEANELALRIARFLTGGTGIIVSDFSYHGNSETLAAMATCFPTPEPFPSFARGIRIPDPANDRNGMSDEELADKYAQQVADAIRDLEASGVKVAALLLDSFFANEGLPDRVPGYVEKAVELVRKAGGIFICDEVQPGFGRTGDAMWGHQLTNVTPDIVTMGKPMGNGHPLAGLVTRREWVDSFGEVANYFNTFGGNPVSAAAGMAVLDVIEQQGLQENSRVVGAYVRERLDELMNRHEIIDNIRGRGLFFGMELVDANGNPAAAETKHLINLMRDRGVLISRLGRYDNVLKMRPPLVFTKENADFLLTELDHALTDLQKA